MTEEEFATLLKKETDLYHLLKAVDVCVSLVQHVDEPSLALTFDTLFDDVKDIHRGVQKAFNEAVERRTSR